MLILSISGPFLPRKQLGGRHLHCELTVWDDSLTSLPPTPDQLCLWWSCVCIFRDACRASSSTRKSELIWGVWFIDSFADIPTDIPTVNIRLRMNGLVNNIVLAGLSVRKLVAIVVTLTFTRKQQLRAKHDTLKALTGYFPNYCLHSASSNASRSHMWFPKSLSQK